MMAQDEMILQGVAMSAYSWSGYNGTGYESLLQQTVESGATSVLLGSVALIDLATGGVTPLYNENDYCLTASIADVEKAITKAQELGLLVFLKPQIHALNPAAEAFNGNPYNNLINSDPENHPLTITNPDAFFAGYKAYIVEWAKLAERTHVPLFSIGNEMVAATTSEFTNYWCDIIDAIREVYNGKLTYAAMTDVKWDTNDEVSQIEFWDKLDYVGVDVYPDFDTGETIPTTPTVEQLNAIWVEQGWNEYLESVALATGKPLLFTETGVASFLGGANRSRYTDALISQSSTIPDNATQANWFQSFVETWMGENQPEWFGGMYFWNNDPPYNAGLYDTTGYTYFGKPAEVVVTSAFGAINYIEFTQTSFIGSDSDDRIALYGNQGGAATELLTRAQSYHSTVIIELNGTILVGAVAETPTVHFYLNGQDYGAVTLSNVESEWSKSEWLKSGEDQEQYKTTHYNNPYVPHSELVSFVFELDEIAVNDIRIARDSAEIPDTEIYISRVTIVPDMGSATVDTTANSLQHAWVQFAEPSEAWGGATGYQFPNGAIPYDVPSVSFGNLIAKEDGSKEFVPLHYDMLATMSGTPDNPITVNGGDGFDTLYLLGSPEHYTITHNGDTVVVTEQSGLAQHAVVNEVERFAFAEEALPRIIGSNSNDTLYGSRDDELFDGGAGTDVVSLSGSATDYRLAFDDATATYSLTDSVVGRDGNDELRNIEALQFSDSPTQWVLEELSEALAAYRAYPAQEQRDVVGEVYFWKNGAPITHATTTLLLTSSASSGEQLLFQHFQKKSDGSGSVELWATVAADVHSLQLEFQLPTATDVAWHYSEVFPQGWQTAETHTTVETLRIGGMGTTPLTSGFVKLGTLTFTTLSELETVEIALTRGELGKEFLAPTHVTLESSSVVSNGKYQHNALVEGNYSLQVEYSTMLEEQPMVTMSDAYAALQIAVGQNPNGDEALLPWQYLAADINRDGKVRASDALAILKMALDDSHGSNESWLFLPEAVGKSTMSRNAVDWSITNLTVEVLHNQTFNLVGVVVGDVDGSYS